jgi:hypothetical protein
MGPVIVGRVGNTHPMFDELLLVSKGKGYSGLVGMGCEFSNQLSRQGVLTVMYKRCLRIFPEDLGYHLTLQFGASF